MKAWEALLTAEYATTKHPDPEHKRRQLRTEIICFVGNTELTEVEELSISTADAKWEGRLVGELQREDYERILWELAELNFRFEFQALDQRLMTLAGSPTGRGTRIRRCFPGGCLLVANWRMANHGIASRELREKAHYLLLMGSLMKDWRGVNPEGWISRVGWQLRWHEEEIESLETEIASFYCQSYYNSFRRAPVVPLRLSKGSAPPPEWYTPTLAPVLEHAQHIVINREVLQEETSVESMVSARNQFFLYSRYPDEFRLSQGVGSIK